MDTTEKYIKMRIKAVPYLGRGAGVGSNINPTTWNHYKNCGSYEIVVNERGNFYVKSSYLGGELICKLERQDQLQEIIRVKTWIKKQVAFYDFLFQVGSNLCPKHFKDKALEEIYTGFADGENLYEHTTKEIAKIFNSFEQAWLAFVMHEEYQKWWDNEKEKWVKEGR